MTFDEDRDVARVVVTDIRMPFWSMVTFMVKWAVASIPAFIVLTAMGFIAITILGALIRPAMPF